LIRFLLHDIIDLRKSKWVTEQSQANERINRIKGGNQLKSVDEVRKEAITKLYGADPRMGNMPNRLMDELMTNGNKEKKEKRGRRKEDKSGFGSFFRSPSGTRENSRDRSGEEKSSFTKSGSYDGRATSKLANLGQKSSVVTANGPRGSIGKQTTKVTTPQKLTPEISTSDTEEDKYRSEKRSENSSKNRSEKRSENSIGKRSDHRSENRNSVSLDKNSQKPVQNSGSQHDKYDKYSSEKISQESYDSKKISEKPKRSRSPAV
jgi:hypothetical protein